MSLAFFLARLAGHPRPCLHRPQWREPLGADTLALLERHEMLRHQGRADWYPCAGACADCTHRRISPVPTAPRRWRVECPCFECPDEDIPEQDLDLLAADGRALARWLRDQLASGAPLRFAHPGLHGLGQLPWRERTREGVLATGVTPPDLPALLRDLAEASPIALVFVPSIRIFHTELRSAHGPRSPLHLVGLDEWLELGHGQLTLRRPDHDELREPPAPPYPAPPVVARVYGHEGERALTPEAYEALQGQLSSFDLALDLTRVVEGSRHPAGKRALSGAWQATSLSRHEAAALAELVKRRVPLAQGEFRTVTVQAMPKLIEGVRRGVDVSLGRYQWRALHLLRGDTPETRRWVFKPPPTLTFAVLVPSER